MPGASTQTVFSEPTDFPTAYSTNYNLTVEQSLGNATTLEIGYVGAATRHLSTEVGNYNVNQHLSPKIGKVQTLLPVGISNYDSLQAKLNRRFSGGYSILASYTWSHARDNGPAPFDLGRGGNYPQNPFDIDAEYSNSDSDVRQHFVASQIIELPFGHGKRFLSNSHGIGQGLIGGWQLNSITTLQTGRPFNVLSNSNDPNYPGLRPNLIGNPHPSHRSKTEWFNPAAFKVPAGQAGSTGAGKTLIVGNAPRNLLYGPGFTNEDLSLFKVFSLPREMKFQVRIEGFNVLNTAHYDSPDSNLAQGNRLGQITGGYSPSDAVCGPTDLLASPSPTSGVSMHNHEFEAFMKSTAMPRRSFLTGLGAAVVGTGFSDVFAQAAPIATPLRSMSREELFSLLKRLLICDTSGLHEFAVEAYATCVLGKIRAADPPLEHAWIVPGGGYYAQWLWDTMFVVDLLSLLPGQEEIIRGVFQNYWDFQKRWNDQKPGFMHGMVANFMAPFDAPGDRDGKEWRTFPAYSQAPLLAWGMERVYRCNHDKELLIAGLAGLESFHEWYWRERDIRGLGLIGVGAYSGDTKHARYETYDREVDLDGLTMVPHPGRPTGANNGAWYGDIAIPANTSYLLLSEHSLARMATVIGNHAMAARRRARSETGAAAMRNHMWDERSGCFLAVRTESLEKITTATVGGFVPIMAGVPTPKQAASMVAALGTSAWATPLPIPTVARTDKEFVSGEFWRATFGRHQIIKSRAGLLPTATVLRPPILRIPR